MRGDAIGGDDVETAARQQHDVRLPRRPVLPRQRFEYLYLAGDIQIVRAGLQSRLHHRQRRAVERAGTIQYRPDAGELFGRGGPVIQFERAVFELPRACLLGKGGGVTAAEHRPQALAQGQLQYQIAGKTVRTVEQERIGQFVSLVKRPSW